MQPPTAPPSDGPKHPTTAFKNKSISQFFLNQKSGICKTNEHQENDQGTGEEKDDTQAESKLEPGINDMGCH
jgi:hypothetical protein